MQKNSWNQSGGFLFWTETNKFWQEWTRLLGPTCSLFGSAVITPSQKMLIILAWPSGDQPWSSLTLEQKQNLKLVEKLLVLVLVQAVPVQAWMTASKKWWITHQVGPPWPDNIEPSGSENLFWHKMANFLLICKASCLNVYQVKELKCAHKKSRLG